MDPRIVTTAIAAAAAALLGFPAFAGAETLHSQIDETSPESTTSQDFEPSFNQFDALAADDFQVPIGEVWELETGLIRANNFGASTTSTVNVTVFADANGLPGGELFAEQVQAPGYPRFQLPLGSVPLLPAGTYWLGVQAVMNGVDPANPQQWFWAENDELFGNRAAWRNPGGGHSAACPTFGVRSTCLGGTHTAPDQSYSLDGSRYDGRLAATNAKAGKKGKLTLTVNAPNVGTLTAKSKQLAPKSVEVTQPGTVSLALKPTAKTKAKLADGKKVEAVVKLSQPPLLDGAPLKATAEKKLKA